MLHTFVFNVYVTTLMLLASLFCKQPWFLPRVYRGSVYGVTAPVPCALRSQQSKSKMTVLSCWCLLWKSIFKINCSLKYSHSQKKPGKTTTTRNQGYILIVDHVSTTYSWNIKHVQKAWIYSWSWSETHHQLDCSITALWKWYIPTVHHWKYWEHLVKLGWPRNSAIKPFI